MYSQWWKRYRSVVFNVFFVHYFNTCDFLLVPALFTPFYESVHAGKVIVLLLPRLIDNYIMGDVLYIKELHIRMITYSDSKIMSLLTGNKSYIGRNWEVKCWGSMEQSESTVSIGNYTSIGNNLVCFVDGNHRMDYATTYPFHERGISSSAPKSTWGRGAPKIGHDVWIGDDVTIMSGVTVGNGAVIGTKSVVTKNVPAYAVVAGNPAKICRFRFTDEMCKRLDASGWWDLPNEFVTEHLAPVSDDVDEWMKRINEYKASTT
jgi:virginiamycin A acetyltransferase